MKKMLIAGIIMFIAFFSMGTLVWFVHDKSNLTNENINHTFKNKNIQDISINGNTSSIKIVKGDVLRLKYNGEKNINYSEHNDILKISENKKDNYTPIINPFKKNNQKIIVEIPDRKLNDINISTDVGNVDLEGVHTNTATIWNNISNITMKNTSFDNLDVKSEQTQLYFDHSTIEGANFKINGGNIKGEHSLIKDSLFILNNGNITFKQMADACDIKASTKNGNISLSYSKQPKNTLLKLNPSNGNKIISNPNFKDDKIGNGENVLEFYSNKGDIRVE